MRESHRSLVEKVGAHHRIVLKDETPRFCTVLQPCPGPFMISGRAHANVIYADGGIELFG